MASPETLHNQYGPLLFSVLIVGKTAPQQHLACRWTKNGPLPNVHTVPPFAKGPSSLLVSLLSSA